MKVLVTAGPTREALDPVRFLSNRSSGKMGYAIAGEAARRGHEVCLVSGPVGLDAPGGVRVMRVETAEEMCEAVKREASWCDVLVMAAAVSDWRPARVEPQKIKKSGASRTLRLERTPDILREVRPLPGERLTIGFAAETRDLLGGAERKLREKGLDLVVANDVSRADSGFQADSNEVVFVERSGVRSELPLLPKTEVAARLMDWIEAARREDVRGK